MMKQMIKRCGILVMAVLIGGLMLAGCQLAQPELGQAETEEISSRAVVTIKTEQETDHYVVKQFNKDDKLVASTVITRDRIPTELKAEATLAYAIIEKIIILADGSISYDREIMDWSIATHSFVFYDERGLGIGTLVKLVT